MPHAAPMSQTIEQCLRDLGWAIVPIEGTSMEPLLQAGRCQAQVAASDGTPFQKGDVVLYRRASGALVLHRIMGVETDGTYLLCGDHQWKPLERVRQEQILAAAQGFFRKGRYIDDNTAWYRVYKRIWNGNLMIRRCCLAILRGFEKKL